MKPLVISLCDYTGVAVAPWVEAGAEGWVVDIRHPKGVGQLKGGIRKVGVDIRDFLLPSDREVSLMSAFPPCTHLAVSGSRWFKGKGLKLLSEAIFLVAVCAETCEKAECPYYIENPVGVLSTHWRKPDYTFHPRDYGGLADNPSEEGYTKKTCLWVGGGFVVPGRRTYVDYRVPLVNGDKIHTMRPSPNRGHLRSITPTGFSRAVFLSNRHLVGL